MNKKIFFSLFLIFVCLFSCSTCFASLTYEEFEDIMTNAGYEIDTVSNNYIAAVSDYLSYENLWIFEYEANIHKMTILSSNYDGNYNLEYKSTYNCIRIKRDFDDDLKSNNNDINENIITLYPSGTGYSSNDYGPNFLIYHKSYPPVSENPELTVDEFKSFDYLKQLLLERTYYLDKDLYYEGQVILTPEEVYNYRNGITEPEEPYIEMSKTEYTENDSSVYLYVYPNDFDITNYGLVFTRYDNLGDTVGTTNYFSPLPSKWNEYYNSSESRYEVNLKDFVDFSFSDVIFYDVGIFSYSSSGDNIPFDKTEFFQYKFSESYDIAPGGTFNITPLIYLSTENPTSILTVTITASDISSGLIYYKIDDSSWIKYDGPFIIDKNCVVYAHIYTSSGSSGYSSKTISNIVSNSIISNRPKIDADDIGILPLEEKGRYNIGWKWKNSTENYTFLYSDNAGKTWYDFKNISRFDNGIKRYMLTVYFSSFPKILYFKYLDENGISSDTITFTISSANSSSAIRDVIVNYDNSGEYIEDNLNDFTNRYDPVVNPNYDQQEGSSLNDLDFSSNDSLLKSALNTIPTTWLAFQSFFNLMNGIWIFIPNIIFELIFALVLIKFFIALIGFLKS